MTREYIFGYDYGFLAGTKNLVAFGNLKAGQVVDLDIRDQFGSADSCEDRNWRRITGQIINIKCLTAGDVETVGEWLIEYTEVPLDIKKIRRRLEDRLRKATEEEIIQTAIKFNIHLF